MKTMTCQQMGGPCELAHHGNTADEVIKAQDRHLKAMVADGDETHQMRTAGRAPRTPSPAPHGVRRA